VLTAVVGKDLPSTPPTEGAPDLWQLPGFAGVVPGSPSTGNGLGRRTCAVAGYGTLPVDWRVGVRRRGLDGRGELPAGQRGGRLAASPLDPPPLDGEDLDVAEPAAKHAQRGDLVAVDGRRHDG
jgi:hypothetical protein